MRPKQLMRIALGILTSIGGVLDGGAIATAADAGSSFRFELLRVIVIGTLCVIFLVEMVGRLAAVSQHTYADAVRERLGFQFYVWPLAAEFCVDTLVLAPHGIRIDRYEQVALTLVGPFGRVGFYLFAASLGITCFGASLEQALETAYIASQALGWNWGQSKRPAEAARFAMAYTVSIVVSSLIMVAGVDPLSITMLSMALTAVIVPIVVTPLLVIMNDRRYLHEHTNGRLMNVVVGGIIALTFVIAVIAIPMEYFGG